MISRQHTTVAVLRSILGQWISDQESFAELVGLSVSWVKKTSAGIKRISPEAAKAVSIATGVSTDWLLSSPGECPPVEIDNRTPYTRESYDRWIATKSSGPEQPSIAGVAQSLATIIKSYCAALRDGKTRQALNDLWKFAKFMEARYGKPINDWNWLGGVTEIQHEVDNVVSWDWKMRHPSQM